MSTWLKSAVRRDIHSTRKFSTRSLSGVVRVNLHIAVSNTNSLYGYFSRQGNPCSHFYVRKDGVIEQYLPLESVSQADLHGNKDTVSIEFQGGVGSDINADFTQEQKVSASTIFKFVQEHCSNVPTKIATDSSKTSNSHGLSWHRLGVPHRYTGTRLTSTPSGWLQSSGHLWYSKAQGKTCPGDLRISKGIPDIFNIIKGTPSPTTAPKPTPAPKPVQQPNKKSVSIIAQEVISGKWGNGNVRRDRLTKAGYNYNTIQSEVNRLLSTKAKPKPTPAPKPVQQPNKKSVSIIAQEVISGKWGNGNVRRDRLTKAGYNYSTVQAEVNRRLRK